MEPVDIKSATRVHTGSPGSYLPDHGPTVRSFLRYEAGNASKTSGRLCVGGSNPQSGRMEVMCLTRGKLYRQGQAKSQFDTYHSKQETVFHVPFGTPVGWPSKRQQLISCAQSYCTFEACLLDPHITFTRLADGFYAPDNSSVLDFVPGGTKHIALWMAAVAESRPFADMCHDTLL